MKKFVFLKGLLSAFLVAIVINFLSQNALAFAKEGNDNMVPMPKEMLEKPEYVKEKEREDMRDKSHDFRLKIGDNTSIGIVEDGVSLRKVFLLQARF